MGQTQSNCIPSGKHYKYSYCKQLDNLVYTFLPESINLSLNLNFDLSKNENYILNFIYVSIYYKIKNLGYNIKENTNYYIPTNNVQLNTPRLILRLPNQNNMLMGIFHQVFCLFYQVIYQKITFVNHLKPILF